MMGSAALSPNRMCLHSPHVCDSLRKGRDLPVRAGKVSARVLEEFERAGEKEESKDGSGQWREEEKGVG